jgi:hypothetical protein
MAETFGMRPSNKQRSRNKSGNNNNNNNQNQRRNVGNIINRVFESAGPDGKVRGTPQQIIDKYQALGRDAQVAGDRVAAESFLQHAEHYSRMLGEAQRQQAEQRVGQDREEGGGPRFDGPRQDGGRPDGHQPERERTTERASPSGDYGSSGMTTIDAGENDYGTGGLIETPEGRGEPAVEVLAGPMPAEPAPSPAPSVVGVNGHGAPADEPAPRVPARRGRPRRTSRSTGEGDSAPSATVAD